MENWDLYNINREKTGETVLRGHKLKNDTYRLVAAICVFNDKKELLIQKRQKDKVGWPDMWDITAAGSAVVGETSSQAAERELYEEIGLKVDFTKSRPVVTVNFETGFCDYYCVNKNVDIDKLTLQKEEVQDVKWADKETVLKMIDENQFIPYYKSLITMLFDMKDADSFHIRKDK